MRREVEIFQAALVDDDIESARLMAELGDDELHELIRVTLMMCGTARQVLVGRHYRDHAQPEAGGER